MSRVFDISFITGLLFITGCGLVSRGCNDTKEVAYEEYGPRAALKKYEWFKDASASLDKKKADIELYEKRISSLKKDYKGTSRKDWDRTDKEQMGQWQTESLGVKSSFNKLAAEYNSNMSKINYRFANAGELPKGAATPLPRSYKTYVNK